MLCCILQNTDALVQIAAFLCQVNVVLITYEQLMTSIARIDGRRVELVTIAQDYAMKTTANQ